VTPTSTCLLRRRSYFTTARVGLTWFGPAIVWCSCGIELILNATNLTLVTFSVSKRHLDGQIMAFVVMVVRSARGRRRPAIT